MKKIAAKMSLDDTKMFWKMVNKCPLDSLVCDDLEGPSTLEECLFRDLEC